MGKLKEHYLNNLTPEEMEERYGVSAFEYVELMENYKKLFDDNGDPLNYDYEPTQAEIDEMEAMIQDYYKSKEFRDYVDNLSDSEIDAAFSEHNAHEEGFDIDEINNSIKLKYSDSDVIQAIKSVKDEQWFINRIMKELNGIWNTKNGVE